MARLGLTGGRFALVLCLALLAAIGAGRAFAQDEATPTDEEIDDEADGTPTLTVDIEGDLVVVERAVTDTRIDLGDPGESIGDMTVFANPIFDETNTDEVGGNQGTCFLTNPGIAYECSWTLFLDDGQITVQGPVNVDGSSSVLAVTGGTGAYAGASGQMLFETLDPDAPSHLFTYELE